MRDFVEFSVFVGTAVFLVAQFPFVSVPRIGAAVGTRREPRTAFVKACGTEQTASARMSWQEKSSADRVWVRDIDTLEETLPPPPEALRYAGGDGASPGFPPVPAAYTAFGVPRKPRVVQPPPLPASAAAPVRDEWLLSTDNYESLKEMP